MLNNVGLSEIYSVHGKRFAGRNEHEPPKKVMAFELEEPPGPSTSAIDMDPPLTEEDFNNLSSPLLE